MLFGVIVYDSITIKVSPFFVTSSRTITSNPNILRVILFSLIWYDFYGAVFCVHVRIIMKIQTFQWIDLRLCGLIHKPYDTKIKSTLSDLPDGL